MGSAGDDKNRNSAIELLKRCVGAGNPVDLDHFFDNQVSVACSPASQFLVIERFADDVAVRVFNLYDPADAAVQMVVVDNFLYNVIVILTKQGAKCISLGPV